MKIALTSSCFYPIGGKYGSGVPNFVGLLSAQLTKRGHNVDVFTVGTSKVSAHKIDIFEKGSIEAGLLHDAQEARDIAATIKTFRILEQTEKNYDVIHNNQWNSLALLETMKFAHAFSTVHNPTNHHTVTQALAVDPAFSHAKLVAISDSQRADSKFHFFDRIYNGINLQDFTFVASAQKYITWLGRYSPVKGLIEALHMTHELNAPFRFGGSPAIAEYEKLAHDLANEYGATNIGLADPTLRNTLLGQARVLLYPVQWDEPFGFIFVEAMACGTPVITYDRGAASEIIVDGVTGFVVPKDDEVAMKAALQKIITMPEDAYTKMRRACRTRVEELFTIEKMTDQYEQLYEKIIATP